MIRDVHIEICNHCKGEGVKYVERTIDYHKREHEYIPYTCHICNGSGRMMVTTEKEPYVPKIPEDRPQG